MRELEILLGRRWVLKSEDRELYYRIRDSIGEIRRFAAEKLGCQVIENALLVKLEKIPALPEAFMGIRAFTSQEEYALLCILLMFLEDRDSGEQFILSQLTEYISANVPGEGVDWTLYATRRRLVRVLRYAAEQGLIQVTDGNDDAFMDQETGEVLYENAGASRYFMRNFSRDIMGYTRPEDFQESDWFAMDEDRGSAFLMQGEDCRIGEVFPGNTGMSDILLLCCGEIRRRVEDGVWTPQKDDRITVQEVEFDQLLRQVKEKYGAGFIKGYRELPEGEFIREAKEEMERWTFIRRDRQGQTVTIYPSAGKLTGRYPKDYAAGDTTDDTAGQAAYTADKGEGAKQ